MRLETLHRPSPYMLLPVPSRSLKCSNNGLGSSSTDNSGHRAQQAESAFISSATVIIVIKIELAALSHRSVRRNPVCKWGLAHRKILKAASAASHACCPVLLQSFPSPHRVEASVEPPVGEKGAVRPMGLGGPGPPQAFRTRCRMTRLFPWISISKYEVMIIPNGLDP